MRVASGERIERLRRQCVEEGIDGVGVSGLQTGVGLEAEPGHIFLVDIVVETHGLHLLVIVT